MKQLNKNTKDTSDTLSKLKNGLFGIAAVFGAGFGFRELTSIADNMQLLTDRIAVFVGSSDKATSVVNRLAEVANYTKTSITDLGSVYNRFAVATQTLGLDSDALLSTVQLLQQTFRLSGATQEEAAGSTIQLSQAFSLGKLSGQELRSVLLGNATLAGILRKEIGNLGGTIEDFARRGLITPAFLLKALSKNFVEINERADKLGQTFGQTITLAMNDFSVALGEVNKQFDLSGKFAKGIEFLKDSLPVLKAVFVGIAVVAVPALAAAFAALLVPVLSFIAALSPLVIGIGLVATGFTVVISDLERFKIRGEQIFQGFIYILDTIISKLGAITQFFGSALGIRAMEEFGIELRGNFAEGAEIAANKVKKLQDNLNGVYQSVADLKRADEQSGVLKNFIPADITDKVKAKTTSEILKDLEAGIGSLNSLFNKGKIDVETYNSRLEKLTVSMLDIKQASGKMSLNKVQEELSKLNRENIGRLFEYGKLSLEEYNAALKQLDIGALTQKFEDGKIAALQYHQEILKLSDDFQPGSALYVGVNQYIESSGTLATNIAGGITNVFNTLEDSLMDFIKTGTFEFRKFTQAILDDIARIIIRASIVQPLANGILSAFGPAGASAGGGAGIGGGGLASTPSAGFANGGAFDRGVQFFAEGGVVSRTTAFGMSGGNIGVMGEAGPEAILPLTRKNGKLGVSGAGSNVQVNIINQTGGQVEQSERQTPGGDKIIDILITTKMKENFNNGSMDKTLASNFGFKRVGN